MSVRIIAGKWKGRKLPVPEGLAVRPTSERVREAVFSRLQSMLGDWEGLRVADICAGSGAFGIEAVSRGAAHATFVEQDRSAANAILQMFKRLDQTESARILCQDARTLPVATTPYDIVYLDPPYAEGLHIPILERLAQANWIQDTSILVTEAQGNDPQLPDYLNSDSCRFICLAIHQYGKTKTYLLSFRQDR